ncbi:MAG TPA: PASTA domain-containing protein [Gaiellaceae bacterium]|nr:PASTA domain-containing protein [Gaiellaceae bacterium]
MVDTGQVQVVVGGVAYDWFVFFQPAPLDGPPPGMKLDRVAPYTGSGQPITLSCTPYQGWIPGCTAGAYNLGNPGSAVIADALRAQLTATSDTCAGAPCPWGAAGGDATHTNSTVVSCVLTGCPSTALASTFTMPDCWGMTTSTCDAAMRALGFTGTLSTTTASAGEAVYDQPAGAVIATDPAALGGVSTAVSTVVDATTNPNACESDKTDNPHWSTQTGATGSMLSYVHIICTFSGTASYTATMYRCTDDPGSNGINLATSGCVAAATCARSISVVGQEESIAYCPWVDPPGDDVPVGWTPDYWIATSATTTPGVLNGAATWSQPNWKPAPPP